MKPLVPTMRSASVRWPFARAIALLAALLPGLVPCSPRADAATPVVERAQAAIAPQSPLRVSPAAREAERRSLELKRQGLEREYAAQRAACMKRFFVFDCLDAAARRQRDALRVLRARRQHIDLLGREQRARQELESVGQRTAQHAAVDPRQQQEQREMRAQREAAAQRTRQQRASAGAAASTPARALPELPRRQAAPPAAGPALAPEPASQARAARQQRRQREIEYHDLRERVREQQRTPPAPALPVPAASGPLRVPR